MNAALHALLEGLIDYAGLFPPAGLAMGEATASFRAYRACDERWILGRFVVPAARANELEAAAGERAPFPLTVLARPDALETDARELDAGAFEIGLPRELLAGAGAAEIESWIRTAATRMRDAGRAEVPLFLEAGGPETWRAVIHGLAAAREAGFPVAFKIRTGGLEAAAFPASADLAAGVIACRDAGVPFKATAGLHHPLRRADAEIGTRMHGFLNLFGGAVLARVHALTVEQLTAILEDEDSASWSFADDELRRRELAASANEVASARRELAISFGSCSFDEPRDDLRALGWLS